MIEEKMNLLLFSKRIIVPKLASLKTKDGSKTAREQVRLMLKYTQKFIPTEKGMRKVKELYMKFMANERLNKDECLELWLLAHDFMATYDDFGMTTSSLLEIRKELGKRYGYDKEQLRNFHLVLLKIGHLKINSDYDITFTKKIIKNLSNDPIMANYFETGEIDESFL